MLLHFQYLSTSIIVLLLLTQSALCDQQSIISQLDSKYKVKQDGLSLKAKLLSSLAQQSDFLKMAYAELVQANIAAESSYKSYYTQKSRCQGLRPEFGFVGEVSSLPQDFCPSPPIAIEAVDQYTQIQQLNDLKYNAEVLQRIYNEQKEFNTDYFTESGLNTRLRQIAYIPLSSAVKKYGDCMSKYANSQNQEPVQCNKFKEDISKYETVYGKYRGREVTFGMASKVPVLSLDIKKSLYERAQSTYTEFDARIKPNLDILKTSETLCLSNLNNLLLNVNQRLKSSVDVRNKVNNQKDKIFNIQQQLGSVLTTAKKTTEQIKNLSEKLKNSFP